MRSRRRRSGPWRAAWARPSTRSKEVTPPSSPGRWRWPRSSPVLWTPRPDRTPHSTARRPLMRTRRKSLAALVVAVLTAALLTAGGVTLPATATVLPATTGSLATPSRDKPTIVLVHGAFADSSGWSVVAAGLQAQGYPVLAFANPLRGVQYDSAYLRSVLDTIPGPIVLVGHSYGGAVITNASTGDPDIRSLVYLAAYALDEGETVQQANALGGGQTDLGDHLVI